MRSVIGNRHNHRRQSHRHLHVLSVVGCTTHRLSKSSEPRSSVAGESDYRYTVLSPPSYSLCATSYRVYLHWYGYCHYHYYCRGGVGWLPPHGERKSADTTWGCANNTCQQNSSKFCSQSCPSLEARCPRTPVVPHCGSLPTPLCCCCCSSPSCSSFSSSSPPLPPLTIPSSSPPSPHPLLLLLLPLTAPPSPSPPPPPPPPPPCEWRKGVWGWLILRLLAAPPSPPPPPPSPAPPPPSPPPM